MDAMHLSADQSLLFARFAEAAVAVSVECAGSQTGEAAQFGLVLRAQAPIKSKDTMRRTLAALSIIIAVPSARAAPAAYAPQEGDVLFQSLPHGDLVDAIEGVSHSRYSHVGLLIQKDGAWFVREAIGPVRDTPLQSWIERGRYAHAFDAYRLRAPLQAVIPRLINATEPFMGRPYDFRYRMDDDAIYCSELVYKAMLSATGLRLGALQLLGSLDWKPYRATIEKYEEGKAPLDRAMITPKALSEASALEVVYRGMPTADAAGQQSDR